MPFPYEPPPTPSNPNSGAINNMINGYNPQGSDPGNLLTSPLYSDPNAGSSYPYPSSSSGLAGLNSNVYLGGQQAYQNYSPTRPTPKNTLSGQDSTKTIQQMLDEYYGSIATDPKQVAALGQKLAAAGFMNANNVGDISTTGLAYRNLLELSARMYMTGAKLTPDDILAKGAMSIIKATPPPRTVTEVNLTDPASARQMLIQSLQNQLGRNPSPSEYQAFLGALHAAERQHPTVTTRDFKYNASTNSYEQTGQSTQQGVDPSAYAANYGENVNPHEHAAYQAAANYFPALMDAIKAAV